VSNACIVGVFGRVNVFFDVRVPISVSGQEVWFVSCGCGLWMVAPRAFFALSFHNQKKDLYKSEKNKRAFVPSNSVIQVTPIVNHFFSMQERIAGNTDGKYFKCYTWRSCTSWMVLYTKTKEV